MLPDPLRAVPPRPVVEDLDDGPWRSRLAVGLSWALALEAAAVAVVLVWVCFGAAAGATVGVLLGGLIVAAFHRATDPDLEAIRDRDRVRRLLRPPDTGRHPAGHEPALVDAAAGVPLVRVPPRPALMAVPDRPVFWPLPDLEIAVDRADEVLALLESCYDAADPTCPRCVEHPGRADHGLDLRPGRPIVTPCPCTGRLR